MTTSPSSSAQDGRRALGQRLRELRTGAGLTIRPFAEATGQHFTRVSKIENARQLPTVRDIADWCRLAGGPEQEPDLVATLHAVDSAYTEHRRESRAGMKRVLGAHTPQRYEATTVFRIYEHNVVPGLFQTPEYARAMVQFWIRFLGTPNDVEDAVAIRMQRQRIVQRGAAATDRAARRAPVRHRPRGTGAADVVRFGRGAGRPARPSAGVMALPQVSLGIIPLLWWTGFGVVVGGCSHHFRAGIRSSTDLAGGQRW